MIEFDKIPPNDKMAEDAVLLSLLIDNSNFEDTADLSVDDFYHKKNAIIYAAMKRLNRGKEPVDLITVFNELTSAGEIDSAGGISNLERISDTVTAAVNFKTHVKIIKDKAAIRSVIAKASKIFTDGFAVKDADDYINNAQSEILDIKTTSSKDLFYSMTDMMNEAIDRLESVKNGERVDGLNFGMPALDNYIQVHGSKLILIAGRPGMGKTSLALSITRHIAMFGKKVGFLSIEMDRGEIQDRMLSGESNVSSSFFYSQECLSKRTFQDITDAASYLATLPIITDDSECKIEDVKRKCRKLKKEGCEIIFIDQLSKIKGAQGASKFDQYSDNCSELALLKKELRIPIVLLCQLNREVEKRNDKTPTLSDLKQTGMLEEDADIVFLLYRPGYYEYMENPESDPDQSATKIILAKNRQGAKGVEKNVLFNAKRLMFEMGGRK